MRMVASHYGCKKDAALQYKMAPAAQALANYFAGAIQAGAQGAAPAAQPMPATLGGPVCGVTQPNVCQGVSAACTVFEPGCRTRQATCFVDCKSHFLPGVSIARPQRDRPGVRRISTLRTMRNAKSYALPRRQLRDRLHRLRAGVSVNSRGHLHRSVTQRTANRSARSRRKSLASLSVIRHSRSPVWLRRRPLAVRILRSAAAASAASRAASQASQDRSPRQPQRRGLRRPRSKEPLADRMSCHFTAHSAHYSDHATSGPRTRFAAR